jgi:hypothetical protein
MGIFVKGTRSGEEGGLRDSLRLDNEASSRRNQNLGPRGWPNTQAVIQTSVEKKVDGSGRKVSGRLARPTVGLARYTHENP